MAEEDGPDQVDVNVNIYVQIAFVITILFEKSPVTWQCELTNCISEGFKKRLLEICKDEGGFSYFRVNIELQNNVANGKYHEEGHV